MKTVIELTNGGVETYEDAAPSIQPESQAITMVDLEMTVLTQDIPFDVIKKVIFTP